MSKSFCESIHDTIVWTFSRKNNLFQLKEKNNGKAALVLDQLLEYLDVHFAGVYDGKTTICCYSKCDGKWCQTWHDKPYFSVKLLWILYIRGRVWVHHLSLSSGHCRNGDRRWWWLPLLIAILAVADPVFYCLCMQMSGSHHQSPFRQWPELKLRWWTQTLPRLEKKHETTRHFLP